MQTKAYTFVPKGLFNKLTELNIYIYIYDTNFRSQCWKLVKEHVIKNCSKKFSTIVSGPNSVSQPSIRKK